MASTCGWDCRWWPLPASNQLSAFGFCPPVDGGLNQSVHDGIQGGAVLLSVLGTLLFSLPKAAVFEVQGLQELYNHSNANYS